MKIAAALFLIVLGVISGCGTREIKSGDGLPAYRLPDGSTCHAPEGFDDLVNSAGVNQVRSLFLSSADETEVVKSISSLPTRTEIDAAFYVSCGEFFRGELSDEVFDRRQRLYRMLRVEHVVRGVEEWRGDDEGFESSGKLCYFLFSGDQPDKRNVTRLVPAETTADDCAAYVSINGGSHVLLGCTKGRWETRWARQPLLTGPNGWDNRTDSPEGTRYVPDPNCGWR